MGDSVEIGKTLLGDSVILQSTISKFFFDIPLKMRNFATILDM